MTDAATPPPAEKPVRRSQRSRPWRTWALAAVATVAVLVGAALAWGLLPLGPSPQALRALESTSWVNVAETSYGWRFQPQNTTPETGLVIYPGGHVDPRSYAPLARDLAARGHVVAVLKVPLSLAVLAPRAADAPLHQERSVATWVLAGHSLGGVMAARYARSYPDSISGLLLLASYPDAAADLSTSTIPATSIVGTADGVLNTTAWDAARPRLPRDTKIVEIPGGNHSQFGSYGLQGGDNVATISADLQERAIADAAQELFVRAAAYRVP